MPSISKLLSIILAATFVGATSFAQTQPKRVLIIHGPASHGWNEHEFPAGAALLAECLNDSGLGIDAEAVEGWPADENSLHAADAIVLYSDGLDAHVAKGQTNALREAYNRGAGIAVLHFALEAPSPNDPLHAFFLESIGGAFEADWSVNPVWELREPTLAEHPITQGVSPFSLRDEWYFHLRFADEQSGYTPLLSARPPSEVLGADGPRSGNPAVRAALAASAPQALAWAKVDDEGRRGFGFTGGHYHHNWADDNFRTLALNGIAWTAGVAVPSAGLASQVQAIPHTRTIEEAIARGMLDDIRRHLAAEPELLNKPTRHGLTPLHLAVMRNKPDVAELLLELGADPGQSTPSGETVLHLAVNRKSVAIAKLLLEHPVDFSAKDKSGWTVWHQAAAKNALALIDLFAAQGHRPTQLSEAGGTPLHEAAVSASEAMISRLLELGVDPGVVSKDGRTALDIAVEYDNQAAIAILEGL